MSSTSGEVDAGYHARLRLLVPLLVVGGILLPLMAVMGWGTNVWALNAGLLLAGAECLLASYLIHRSLRRGQDFPAASRPLILTFSGLVVLLLITALFL